MVSSLMLLDLFAKSTIVLLLAWLAAALARSASAAVRHRIWGLSLISVLVLPLLCTLLPGWRLPIFPATKAHSPATAATVELARIDDTLPVQTVADDANNPAGPSQLLVEDERTMSLQGETIPDAQQFQRNNSRRPNFLGKLGRLSRLGFGDSCE